ncbi:hypothetical protein, partial [Endozoicomonas sp. ONNA2]|uniref:hypothetical protein n=1 Tax=Endozoicomonas sp. ONNA2 TaxID=2828741 RepID=UPI002147A422
MNTPVGGLPSSAPPLYPAQDADSREADGLVGIMIRYCSDSRGRLNKDRLSGLLGRTIKLVELRTGVLPPTVRNCLKITFPFHSNSGT